MKDCVNTRRNDESICYLFIRRSWCVDCVWKIYWRVTKMDYIQRKGLLYDVLPVLFSWPPLLPTHTHTQRERERRNGMWCNGFTLLSFITVVTSRMQSLCPIFLFFFYSSSPLSQYFEGVSVVSVLSLYIFPQCSLMDNSITSTCRRVSGWDFHCREYTLYRQQRQQTTTYKIKREEMYCKLNKHQDWKADDEKQSKHNFFFLSSLLCLLCVIFFSPGRQRRGETNLHALTWRDPENITLLAACYSQKKLLSTQNDANLLLQD